MDETKPFKIEDYPIGTGGKEAESRVITHVLNGYETVRQYWAPRVEIGEDVFAKIKGILFSDQALAEMDAEKKVPIEIPEGWPKFLAMIGLGKASMKSGKVTGQYPAHAATAEAVNVALNAIKTEENIQSIFDAVWGNGAVTGYPQMVWVEKPIDHIRGQSLTLNVFPWKCVLPDMNFRKDDYSDAQVVYLVAFLSKDDCMARMPDRKAEIEKAFSHSSSIEDFAAQGMTVEDRDRIFSAIKASDETLTQTGRVHVIERHSLIRRPMTLWGSPESEKWQNLDHLDRAGLEEWKSKNPTWRPIKTESVMHWVTTVTMNGQLIENRPHWFQEGRFNCEMFVPLMVDDKPCGLLEFATQNWSMAAIAKTEQVHSLRMNNGNPLVIQEGALTHPETVETETSKPRGKIFVKRGIDVNRAITNLPSKHDQVPWRDLYEESSSVNDRMTVDRNVEGGAQSSQEAAKVFTARVGQSKSKYAVALDNFNRFSIRLENLIVKCFQLTTDSHVMKRWVDPDSGQEQSAEFNKPEGFNIFTGEPTEIANRLDIGKYDVVMTEVDNSLSGRAAELQEFSEVMQSVIAQTPPEFIGTVLSKIPNRICREIGGQIIKNQEAAAKNPPSPEVKMTLPLDKLAFNPLAVQAAQQLGINVQPPAPAGQPGAAPAAPPSPEQGQAGIVPPGEMQP